MRDTHAPPEDPTVSAIPVPSSGASSDEHAHSSGQDTDHDVDPSSEAFHDATRRAEAIIDRLGEQIGRRATVAGRGLSRVAARLREEAEDIWAEAQALRRGEDIHHHD